MSRFEKIILSTSIAVMLVIISITTAYVVSTYEQQKDFEQLKKLPSVSGLETENGVIAAEYVSLWKMNHDVVGWIEVPGTVIDYPVMQSREEPTFYLRRDFHKAYSRGGTPFMSAESDIHKPTGDWLIYGHNMYNGTMFHDLLKYRERAFYEEHPTFRFDTIYEGGQGTYAVIAAVRTVQGGEKDFDYEQMAGMTDEAVVNEYVRQVKASSLYDTGRNASYGDQLVTLSTCEYSHKYGRFYVVAVRVDG